MVGYYVSVINGKRKGLLKGPYSSHEQALANVEDGRARALEIDAYAHFYWFGTCSIEADRLPTSRFGL